MEQTTHDLASPTRLASAIFEHSTSQINRDLIFLFASDTSTALAMSLFDTPRIPGLLRRSPQGYGSMYERPACPQPQSPLLGLPAELRLLICSNMTLLHSTTDWNGAIFSCRQLHQDMLDELDPNDSKYNFPCVRSGVAHPDFGWIRNLSIMMELDKGWRVSRIYFKQLYALHPDKLQLLLGGEPCSRPYPGVQTPYEDLTTVRLPLLATPSGQLQRIGTDVDTVINCKKITLTLEPLASVAGARDKQTIYEVAFKGTNNMYLFAVIQNKEGKQVGRSYTFDTRFETPTPLPPRAPSDELVEKEHTNTCAVCDAEVDELAKTLCAALQCGW